MPGPFTLTLHGIAGLGALAMGAGVLLRGPSRPRNRWFAFLCAALALWNLGFAARLAELPGSDRLWTLVLMLGSCATAPIALGFAGRLAGWPPRPRRRAVLSAAVAAGALWVATATPFYDHRAWPYTAIAVLGAISAGALFVVARRAASLPPGPERRALWWVLAGGSFAVLSGVSDFLPRARVGGFTELGPTGVLAFLLVMAAVVVRHRFLDVDLFLLRTAAWFVGSAVVALVFDAALRLSGQPASFGVLFATALVVAAIGGPLGRVLLSGARSLVAPSDALSTTLVGLSRNLRDADGADRVWGTIDHAVEQLPGHARLRVFWSDDGGGFRQTYGEPATFDPALSELLRVERAPLTTRFLEQEAAESRGTRARTVSTVLDHFKRQDLRLVTPLLHGEQLSGFIEVAGGLPARYLTGEVAAAFMAVGHQAAEALDRIAAREIAQRREKLAAVGELSAGLAHEVRNPVAAIRGAAQAIGPTATAEQRDAMLDVIQEETARLERVVAEFLDYARPTPPRREPVDLGGLARRVAEGATLAGWGLTIDVEVADDAPRALGDSDQLQRVFENLVRNAWEAAGDRGRLRIAIRPEGTDRVGARFEDDGPGIEPEQMARIFAPFHTTKPGGTGLGLALIHRVIEAHDGTIQAESSPGEGSTFTLALQTVPD